jgi:hypothetical protein
MVEWLFVATHVSVEVIAHPIYTATKKVLCARPRTSLLTNLCLKNVHAMLFTHLNVLVLWPPVRSRALDLSGLPA